jgi:SnoaL-like domain
MSEAQMGILRELNVAFNADADWARFYDPDAELHMPSDYPDDSVFKGTEGLKEAVRLWREGFDEYHWAEERLIDGDDCVVGLYYHRGRIKQGGAWIDQPIGCVYRFRGEKLLRVDGYFSWAEAMKAGGVEEAAG